jgi:purine-nucleoside phosphorylase
MNTDASPTRSQYEESVTYVRKGTQYRPTVGLILGSGLSPLAEDIESADIFPYTSIPHFPASTVAGHRGRLVIGTMEGREVVAMQGRIHYYEGYAMQQVTFPIRVMCLLGVDTLIVTNAAGGLASRFTPGDLMLISDHINLVGMAGHNPLIGPNDPSLGPRFPDMSNAYDPALRVVTRQVAQAEQIALQEGVYICLAGPSFETPAEVRALRLIGADAVGMSTVHEVIVARHMGVRVLGISGITNVHAADASQPQETTHQEVLEAGRVIAPHLIALIRGVLKRL